MAENAKKVGRNSRTGRFAITSGYVRGEAAEAVRTFVAPLAGAARAFQKAGRPAEPKAPAKAG